MLPLEEVTLVRISEYARNLHDYRTDEELERAFNTACMTVWGYTLDDLDDDMLSAEDHAWLDRLTEKKATAFASANGYDLRDYIKGGIVPDWWGFTWMILAEKRGLLTPQNRDFAWRRYEESLLSKEKVVGFIGRR